MTITEERRKFLSEAGAKGGRATGMPLEKALVKNSPLAGQRIKRRLLESGLLPIECATPECPVKTEWKGKRLVLVLDHINGDRTDNRIENLRLLCPNCNSQTETFCRNKRILTIE